MPTSKTRGPGTAAEQAPAGPPTSAGLVSVTVTSAGAGRVADGEGGWCADGQTIAVAADTAAALKARAYAA